MALIDLKNATIRLQSGDDHIDVKIGEGNLDFTEKRNIEVVKSRGELYTMREGDEEAMEVSFQFVWESLESATGEDPPTIEDVLKHQGNAVNWNSTNPDPDAPFCIDIEVDYVKPTACGGDPDEPETLLLKQFNYEQLAHSLKDATVDCSGKCNETVATNS